MIFKNEHHNDNLISRHILGLLVLPALVYLRVMSITFSVCSFCVFHQVHVGVIAPPHGSIWALEASQNKQLEQK